MASIGESLKNRGFDTSRYDSTLKSWIVGCSGCKPDYPDGVATHKEKCPNRAKVKVRQAKGKSNRLRAERKKK